MEYDPGAGKRAQNAWTKRWTIAEESGNIEKREETVKLTGGNDMMVEPIWWDWAIFDDEEGLVGIRDDAPKEAKKAYKEYLKITSQVDEDGGLYVFN